MSRVAVITGTTHGIGRVSSLELARAGYTVVMLCRDITSACRVRDEIVAQIPAAQVHVQRCDLASLESVHKCAAAIRGDVDRVALLINNAGMVSARHRMSVDGFELTFATNHLGPFLLTNLLLDRMSEYGRIINVASRVHYRGKMNLDDITNARAHYGGTTAYARSKLANVMFTFALARRLAGTRITANCLHPGVVATNLLPRWLRVIKPLLTRVILDVERGSRSTLYLALSDEVANVSGRYFDEYQQIQAASELALDVPLQESLWARSERWTAMPMPSVARRIGAQ